MALTAQQAEDAEWSGRRGDYIARSWTHTSGDTVYDDADPFVQIRSGPRESSTLAATSDYDNATADEYAAVTGADPDGGTFAADLAEWLAANPVAAITTTGSDLAAADPVIAWQCAADEYRKISSGTYWIGFDVLIDGEPKEIMRHTWQVLDQTAVRR